MNGFRIFVIVTTLFFCAWFFLPFAPVQASEDVQRILSLSGYGASIDLNQPVVYVVSFLLRMVAMVGLFLCARWAVLLLGVWLLLNIFLSLFGGVVVYTGFDTMIGYIATLLDGILLSFAYFKVWRPA